MVSDTNKFQNIGHELETLLTELTDSDDNKVFENVLLGFP